MNSKLFECVICGHDWKFLLVPYCKCKKCNALKVAKGKWDGHKWKYLTTIIYFPDDKDYKKILKFVNKELKEHEKAVSARLAKHKKELIAAAKKYGLKNDYTT